MIGAPIILGNMCVGRKIVFKDMCKLFKCQLWDSDGRMGTEGTGGPSGHFLG